jgi:hypothetical protein
MSKLSVNLGESGLHSSDGPAKDATPLSIPTAFKHVENLLQAVFYLLIRISCLLVLLFPSQDWRDAVCHHVMKSYNFGRDSLCVLSGKLILHGRRLVGRDLRGVCVQS